MITLLPLALGAMFLSMSLAHAIIVPFSASLNMNGRGGITFANPSIVSDVRVEQSGTGRVSRGGVDFRIGNSGRLDIGGVEVSVGTRSGHALVNADIILTFDILFPDFAPSSALIDIIVPSDPGHTLRAGESASLEYDLSIFADGGILPQPQVDLSGSGLYTCADIPCIPEIYTAEGEFIVVGDNEFRGGKARRLPVTMTARFALQADAVPAAIPEPAPLALLGVGLLLAVALRRSAYSH